MVTDKRAPCSDALVKYSGRFSQDIPLFGRTLELEFKAGNIGFHGVEVLRLL
jgi:hypothetical protein